MVLFYKSLLHHRDDLWGLKEWRQRRHQWIACQYGSYGNRADEILRQSFLCLLQLLGHVLIEISTTISCVKNSCHPVCLCSIFPLMMLTLVMKTCLYYTVRHAV